MNLLLFIPHKKKVFSWFARKKSSYWNKPFPNPFLLHFTETADRFRKWEKGAFMLIYFSHESKTSPVHEASITFQLVFFLPGFMFPEYLKAQLCSTSECLKIQQGFFFHQSAPYFHWQKVINYQQSACDVQWILVNKVQESLQEFKTQAGYNPHHTDHNDILLNCAIQGFKQWKVLLMIMKWTWKMRH